MWPGKPCERTVDQRDRGRVGRGPAPLPSHVPRRASCSSRRRRPIGPLLVTLSSIMRPLVRRIATEPPNASGRTAGEHSTKHSIVRRWWRCSMTKLRTRSSSVSATTRIRTLHSIVPAITASRANEITVPRPGPWAIVRTDTTPKKAHIREPLINVFTSCQVGALITNFSAGGTQPVWPITSGVSDAGVESDGGRPIHHLVDTRTQGDGT
ncbi:hypothetical protein BH24ACT5_BH24ACT5_10520 [soil metagenome]